jgi:predicted DNA-binding transcriptional regulator AlpA
MEQATIEKLVTARVVAEAMGMAVSQVYRLAAEGSIKSFLVGHKKGGVRFDLREVREDLRRRPAASKAQP